jgi:hypothetical protein
MDSTSTAMADGSRPSARANKCVKRNPTASLSSDSCCNVFRSDSSACRVSTVVDTVSVGEHTAARAAQAGHGIYCKSPRVVQAVVIVVPIHAIKRVISLRLRSHL